MSDDIVDPDCECWTARYRRADLTCPSCGAKEIVRLRARVTELEAWEARYYELREAQIEGTNHFIRALGERDAERALADQLAEALREVSEVTKVLHGRGDLADCLIQSFTALAAHEAARKETP